MQYTPFPVTSLIICRSHYSFLEGVHSIPDLVSFARDKGISALCLADRNGLYGALEFYTRCGEAGIKPLIGAELVQGERRVTIVAKNLRGYEELSGLITRCHLEQIRLADDLFPDSSHLLYICRDTFLLQRWLRNGTYKGLLLGLFIRDRNSYHSLINLMLKRRDLQRIPAIPVVYVNFLDPSDWALYKLLRAIDLNCNVDTLPAEELSEREFAEADPLHQIEINTIPYSPLVSGKHIADMCTLEFDLGKYHLPKFSPAK